MTLLLGPPVALLLRSPTFLLRSPTFLQRSPAHLLLGSPLTNLLLLCSPALLLSSPGFHNPPAFFLQPSLPCCLWSFPPTLMPGTWSCSSLLWCPTTWKSLPRLWRCSSFPSTAAAL